MQSNAIMECVPNFSEGRNKKTIDAIAAAISSTQGVKLLDVDVGADTNRTVYTFAGEPKAVVEAALDAARTAYELIDMRRHFGAHPRMGALDVCPFVPVAGISMDECVTYANEFAKRLAQELQVPVYLYEKAARTRER
ncbi:MAG TPA: glutamate formiminotransferase, partial [Spirochaetales bacterium]|nr:glutamate formiminotransferase [Spirochaetales bacterium]